MPTGANMTFFQRMKEKSEDSTNQGVNILLMMTATTDQSCATSSLNNPK